MSAEQVPVTPIGGLVRQHEIESLRDMKHQKKNLDAKIKEAQLYLIRKLKDGAKVESGTFRCAIKTISKRTVAWKQEFVRINGEEMAKSIQANTQPKDQESLEIE